MKVQFIGEPISVPGKKDADGNPAANRIGIATVFPKTGIVVTLPGVHTTASFVRSVRSRSRSATCGSQPSLIRSG